MTSSQTWKNLERTVAEKLGGKRIVRGKDFSVSALDVEHKYFALECKLRAKIGVWRFYEKLIKDNAKLYPGKKKIPILVVKEKGKVGELVVIKLDDFVKVIKEEFLEGE